MKLAFLRVLWLFIAFGAGLAGAAETIAPAGPASSPAKEALATAPVIVMAIDDAIHPATADHVRRVLAKAIEQKAQLVVLELDTPGGLDTSMRAIIKDILASPIPFATYVSPNGARAASAGTYILYASHIAAMAPATNLGAATPVAIGVPGLPGEPEKPPNAEPSRLPAGSDKPAGNAPKDKSGKGNTKKDDATSETPRAEPKPTYQPSADPMTAKRLADASAYIRSLAQLRGRNAEWAEKAVRESVSLSAREALDLKVIDLVATDLKDLLKQVDGHSYEVTGGQVTLATANAPIVTIEADWRSRLLSVIANPSLALILMMIGIYGLIFEFSNPGFVLPGVVGAISLLLGLFALQTLPINYAGLALIVLGIGFLVAEAFVPSFGALGLGGIVAFAVGAVMLSDSDVPGMGIPLGLIALLTALSAAFVLVVVGMAAKARRRPVVSGSSVLVGQQADLVELDGREGWALLNGVHWRVRAAADAAAGGLRPGARVVVRAVHGGSLLEVAPVASAGSPPPTTAVYPSSSR